MVWHSICYLELVSYSSWATMNEQLCSNYLKSAVSNYFYWKSSCVVNFLGYFKKVLWRSLLTFRFEVDVYLTLSWRRPLSYRPQSIDFYMIMGRIMKELKKPYMGVYLYCINQFEASFPFLCSWKHQKTRDFPMFSRGIKREHWLEMVIIFKVS